MQLLRDLRERALALSALAAAACAQTSQQPAAVTAPTTSATVAESPAASAPVAPVATAVPAGSASVASSADDGLPAQYRTCGGDVDCLAVPITGCCPHGYLTAINPSQKDAYERDYACNKTRPICPQFRVRDTRVARCNLTAHLCEMIKP